MSGIEDKKTGIIKRLIHFFDIYGIQLTYNYNIILLLQILREKILGPYWFWKDTEGWTEKDWKLFKDDFLEERCLNEDEDE